MTRKLWSHLLLWFLLIGYASLALALPAKAQNSSPEPAPAETSVETSSDTQETQIPPEQFQPSQSYALGQVIDLAKKDEVANVTGIDQTVQYPKVRILNGPEKGKEVEISRYVVGNSQQHLSKGDKVVVAKTDGYNEDTYYISDRYRAWPLIIIFIFFIALAVIFARFKGLTSVFGLVVSLLVLIKFIIPRILAGNNPLIISFIGAVIIAVLSLYLAHGFSRRTSVALISTLGTLLLATGMAVLFVYLAHLSGLGSEEAFYLQLAPFGTINLHGLLLGGMVIGTLGVLDDVTTSQVAAIDEIKKANPALTFNQLYKSGLSVGQEHIASLVNTLVLAYAGASFPLFLLFVVNQQVPLWVTVNSELVAEEIIRTMVGSSTLILAVPITTFLASYYFSQKPSSPAAQPHSHSHNHHGHHHNHSNN